MNRWVDDNRRTWLPPDITLQQPPLIIFGQRGARATLAYFADTGSKPALIVKVCGRSQDRDPARSEYEALSAVEETTGLLGGRLHPRPFGCLTTPGFSAVSMEALDGRRLELVGLSRPGSRWLSRRRFSSYVSDTRRIVRTMASHDDGDARRDGLRLATAGRRLLEADVLRIKTQDLLEEQVARLEKSSAAWRPTWQHGDLAPGNILRTGQGLRLIDWEDARPDRFPWHDLCYVPLTVCRLIEREAVRWPPPRAVVHALATDRWSGAILRRALTDEWTFDLSIEDGLLTTLIDLTERTLACGRVSLWAHYLDAILTDAEVRRRCAWLVTEPA